MRRWWPWALLGVVVVGVLAWAAWPSGGPRSADERVRTLASELRCVECRGLSVADATTSTARATRDDLRRRVEAGESDAEIRQAYVDRYGEDILLKPEGSGVGMLVWALPVVVLVVGGVGVGFAIARWRREPRLVASAADEAVVAEARRRA